ncbi:amelogenin, X isoform [Ambystoma mexicanum]|uniref:amelogenin, X isoform n=1 Tax=Ambystoma mexicanum TaxID=8296 RepID=UPI0037E8EC2F
MGPWILLTCLLSASCAMPLPPHPNHPGYINFSYEVMTPLKWYQSMMRQQYPSYGYEPMGGWLQSQMMPGSPMMPQQHMQTIPQMQPHHPMMLPQQPMLPHGQMMPLPQHQQLLPQPGHQPMQPMIPQQPSHVLQTAQANHPLQPHQPQHSGQPIYPVQQQQPPLLPDMPLEPWQPADKTNQEEQD